ELQIVVQAPGAPGAAPAFPDAEAYVPEPAAAVPPPAAAPQEFPDAETYAPAEEPPAPPARKRPARKPARARREPPAPPADEAEAAVEELIGELLAEAPAPVAAPPPSEAAAPAPDAAGCAAALVRARARPKPAPRPAPKRDEPGVLERVRQKPYHVAVSVAGVLLLYVLCGRGAADDPTELAAVHPARGQVLCDGKPLPEAALRLYPVGPGDFPRPQGQSKADGSFVLWTYRQGDGVPPGEYRVTVHWFEKLDPKEDRRPRNL